MDRKREWFVDCFSFAVKRRLHLLLQLALSPDAAVGFNAYENAPWHRSLQLYALDILDR